MRYDPSELVETHTPLLVLYPEIPPNSKRERNPVYPNDAPIFFDYHPRDIRIVLDHSTLHGGFPWRTGKPTGWQEMLEKMKRSKYKRDIDVLPGVDLDEREKFWEAYASIPKNEEHYQRLCYARVVEGRERNADRVLIQYWYAYFYNDFSNLHEMDWETVMVVLAHTDGGLLPRICAYSAHFEGHWLPWPEVEKADQDLNPSGNGTHPVVYVANGSHANYFHGPAVYATAPETIRLANRLIGRILGRHSGLGRRRFLDYTTELRDDTKHLVRPRLIPDQWEGEWGWLNQQGRWGSPGDWDLEFGDSGPYGPPETGDKWKKPFRWINTTCTRAPKGRKPEVPTEW